MVGKRTQSSSTSDRCLRNNNNVPVKKKHKTYGKLNNENIENNSKENTLENNLWIDSFDRLLNSASKFHKKKTYNNVVRISYNRDSSFDFSDQVNTSNKNPCKEEKKIRSNRIKINDESSFNLEKSLAAIKHKMKRKKVEKAKCKVQKNQNTKLKNQHQILKSNAVASTPVIKRNFENLLNSCIISPIKSERKKKKLFNNSTIREKLILNYTDSIEEARNLSQKKLINNTYNYDNSKNYSVFMKSLQNVDDFIQNEQLDLVKYNQAGLETDELKGKYVLSYIKKLPSLYEKYAFSDASFEDNLQNTEFSRLCESNKISEYNKRITIQPPTTEQNIHQHNESFHIISLNSTKSQHEPINDIEAVQVLTQEIAMKEIIESKNKLSHNIYKDSINNKSKSSNYEQSDIEKTNNIIDSIQIIDYNKEINKKNTDELKSNIKSVDIDTDMSFTAQKISDVPHNIVFANKLKFLQNCQILNDNIKFTKSLQNIEHDISKNISIRRNSFESYNTKKKKIISDNIKTKDVLSVNLNSQKYCRQSYNSGILSSGSKLTLNRCIEQISKPISKLVIQNNIAKDIFGSTDSNFKNDERFLINLENMSDIIDKVELNSCVRTSMKQTIENPKKVHDNNIKKISDENITKRRLRHTKRNNNIIVNKEEHHTNQLINNKKDSSEIQITNIDDSCEIIPGTPQAFLTRRAPIKLVKNVTPTKDLLKLNENNIKMRQTRHKLTENRTLHRKYLLDTNHPDKSRRTYENLVTVTDPEVQLEKVKENPKTIGPLEETDVECHVISGTPIVQLEKNDGECDIIPKTPIVQLKTASRYLNTRKIIENYSEYSVRNNENSNINFTRQYKKRFAKSLSNDKKIPNKHKKISFETKELDANHKTETKSISRKNIASSESKLEKLAENDNILIIKSPVNSNHITRNRKITKTFKLNKNFAIEDEVLHTNVESTDMKRKLNENKKRIKNSSLKDKNISTKQKKLPENVHNKIIDLDKQKHIFKLKNCKVMINKRLPKIIKDTKNIEQKFKLKKCQILLKRMNLNITKKLGQNNLNNASNNASNKLKATKIVSFSHIAQKSYNSSTRETISGVGKCFPTDNQMNSSENDCSVIEISFNDDEFRNKITTKKSSKRKTIKKNYLISQKPISEKLNFDEDDKNERVTSKLKLHSGKWRRTLVNWKMKQSIIELDDSQISVVLDKNTTNSLGETIAENKNKLMPKISSSYKQNTIISDQLLDRELKTQILPVQKIINNDRKTCLNSSLVYISEKPDTECKIIEKRQTGVRKTLLLEPTDDGTPYTTCSLFNTFTKPKAAETVFVSNRQKTKNSKRFIEIEEEDFNDLDNDQQQQQQGQQKKQQHQHHREEYSDETRCINTITHNKIQKFQHQLSVPICGTKHQQSTIQRSTRRGRTSIIETTNNSGFQQLSSSPFIGSGDYHHHQSDREFIHSLLLNDDEQDVLLCPSLNVSIRALLSPRDIVLRRCGQTDPYDFSIIYSELELRQCRKIGEGVYGEVYMNKNRNGEAIVLKIIPIDGQIEINGEQQKNFEQILPEIIIAAELSHLRNDSNFMTSGFVDVKNVHCVQGRYPQHLIDLWELYRDNCGTENDNPEIFQDDQLYIVLELANGGQDLEAFQFQNALQSYSAFLQTALSLAVAERKFKFEHRDLHWGNILLAATDEKEIKFKFNEKIISIPTHGVKATIIDYTLSRMNFEGCCLYNDLSNDNELFTASGDYQFDIYRLMKKNVRNQWERYDPYTNILWLHYTIDKMISGARYRASKTKKHRSAIQDMMQLRDELLDYKSASDYVECLD